jgi:hypothetical protein
MATTTYPYAPTGGTTTEEDIDPLTGKARKPANQLPTWDNPVQNVSLNPGNISTQSNNLAQNKAQGGFQSNTMDAVVAGTQSLLKDPSMGKDYAAEKGLQLEQQNRNMNQQLETLRQQTAPQAYTGKNLRDLTNVAMQGIQQRADTGRQIDIEQNKAQREAQIAALAEGRTTATQERGAFDQDIQNLIQSSEGQLGREVDIQKLVLSNDFEGAQAEIDRKLKLAMQNNDIVGQKELATLQSDLTLKRMVAEQDFTGAQSELSRQLQLAMQSNDIAAQDKLTRLKGEIDAKAQTAQQEFARTERIATQGWQSGERISSQDYQTVSKKIDQDYALALQKNDIASAEKLADQKGKLDLLMQTNSMNQQEKMTYLDAKLAEAKADGDVNRQKTILAFTQGQDLEKMRVENGYTVMRDEADRRFQESMKKGDFLQARTILELQQGFQMEENAKDRILESARNAMQQQGLDFDQFQANYIMLKEQDPTAAFNYLQSKVKPLGVSMEPIDAATKAKDAIAADFDAQEYQFGLTHPTLIDPITKKLTPDGQAEFYKYFNESIYGKSTTGTTTTAAQAIDLWARSTSNNPTISQGDASAIISNWDNLQDNPRVAPDWSPQIATDNNAGNAYISQYKGRLTNLNGQLYKLDAFIPYKKGETRSGFRLVSPTNGSVVYIDGNGNDGSLWL